jgi:hypothetical protein
MNAKERIKNELIELVNEGNELIKKFEDTKKESGLHFDYQEWYSRALRAIEWLAPDRYEEFRQYYEPDPKRKSLGYGTYVIQDYLKGVKPGHWQLQDFDCRRQATIGLYNQFTILASVVKRINSTLGDIQGTLYAELQDEEIESAALLLKVNARAAGALAGVILEGHLQKVAQRHNVRIAKKAPTIADLNDPLKSAAVYDTAAWRKISYLADIRNLCSHKKVADPTQQQVAELIDGVRWAVKNIS